MGPCHWGCDDWRWCFVRPVLPKIQPMSCDDDFMPIFPTLWETLLRTVFKDWIVDDGNYYPRCGNPLMAIMTHFGEILVKVCLKTLLAVCSVVNSAGQRVLFVQRKSNCMSCKNLPFEINFWEMMPWALKQVPHLISYIGLQTFFLLFAIVLETP